MTNETRIELVLNALRWANNIVAEVANNHSSVFSAETRASLRAVSYAFDEADRAVRECSIQGDGDKMIQKIVAEISFLPDMRDQWPTKVFNAEAYLDLTPWSMHAELWGPPTEHGIALAWVSFLSPKAPFFDLPLGASFELKLGKTVIGSAKLKVWPQVATGYEENDFVSQPDAPVRRKVAPT